MTENRAFQRAVFACSAAFLAFAMSGCGSGGGGLTTTKPTPLTITYSGSASGQLTVAYSGSFAVAGGTAPYRCSLASGPLPSGLSLNASACTVTGTPTGTDTGAYQFSVIATDSASSAQTATASPTLSIAAAPFAVTTSTLPTGAVGTSYMGSITTSGGANPSSCKYVSGSNDGLTVNSNCTVSGSPTTSGTFSLVIQATDGSSPAQTANGTVTLTIFAGPNTRVSSGSSPMVGASVQLYAAGATGNGSAPTALLSVPLTTDSSGIFKIPSASNYTCPSATSIVYAVATGGRVGSTGAATPAAAFMASPGACSTLATTSSLVLDEASTVASAYAFAQFLKPGSTAQLGAASTNLTGITAAAATANNLVPSATGIPAALGSASSTAQSKVNMIANILNACVAGGGSSTPCQTLFSATTISGVVPADTLSAAILLAQNPGIATSALYALVPSSPAYTPTLTTAPSDWTLAVIYTGGGLAQPTGLAIDSTGRIWVANDRTVGVASLFTNLGVPVYATGIGGNYLYDSFGVAIDANDTAYITNFDGGFAFSGSITAINKNGGSVSGFPNNNATIFYPDGVALDPNGTIWVADYGDAAVSLLNADGSAKATYSGKQFVFPFGIAVDGNHVGWAANQSSNTVTRVTPDGSSITTFTVGNGPTNVAVDANNNVWVTNTFANTAALITSAGVVKSGTAGYTAPSLAGPEGMTLDGNGNVWIANYHGTSVSELAGASATTPGASLSPSLGWGADAGLAQAYGTGIDRSGNLWVASQASSSLTEFVGVAAPVKTPILGPIVKP